MYNKASTQIRIIIRYFYFVKNYIFLFLFSTTIILSCYSDPHINNIMAIESAFNYLSTSDVLFINDIEQASAFFIILDNQNAIGVFFDLLLNSKTGAGKFYALLGLFEREINYYKSALNSIDLTEEVIVLATRSSTYEQVSSIEELKIIIENGKWMENLNDVLTRYQNWLRQR